MLYYVSFVCFVGAAIRLFFYRLARNKTVTMKYLQSTENEEQLTSTLIGFFFFIMIGFLMMILIS